VHIAALRLNINFALAEKSAELIVLGGKLRG
jgi:hypothetical protein